MSYLVDPIVPEVLIGWFVLNDDQHRRLLETIPGTTGEQAHQDWLSPLREIVQRVSEVFELVVEFIVSPLSTVKWIQERFALHRDRVRLVWGAYLARGNLLSSRFLYV